MKQYSLSIIIVLLIFSAVAQAQFRNKIPLPIADSIQLLHHPTFLGGNLGLAFGDITSISIAPTLHYYLQQRVLIGIGAAYHYVNDKSYYPSFLYNIYGGRLFSNIYITDEIYAHAEYQYLLIDSDHLKSYLYRDKLELNSILLGGGYKQIINHKLYANILFLWDTNYNPTLSPYSNPVIRTGLYFGI